jgi:hypothetical protein
MRDCPTVLSEDGLIFWDLGRPHRLLQAPLTETKRPAIARGFDRFRVRHRGSESLQVDATVTGIVRLDERPTLRA